MLTTSQLAELIHKKHQILSQLREVGRRQENLIEDGDVTTLLTLLSAKQHLISGLQSVERQLAPFHSEDPDSRQWPTSEARARCAREAAECSQLLNEIVHLERQHELKMIERRNHAAHQLRQAHHAGEASGAYRAHGRIPGSASLASPAASGQTHLDLASEA